MSGLADAVVAVAVIGLVLVRQVRPRRVAEGRSWWLLPAVLAYLACQRGGWTDPHHTTASALLLAAELVIALCMGTAWAFTTRIWRDETGVAWTRGTKATAAAWVGGILLRVGLGAVGAMMGVHEGTGSIMLALAVTLLIRRGVLAWRAGNMDATAIPVTATP
jgi:hypothetical protein